MRDCLIANIHKTVWLPSTATYSDKLTEFQIEHPRHIAVFIENENMNSPELKIIINLDENRKYNEKELEQIYTIDNIIPKIIEINYSRYL